MINVLEYIKNIGFFLILVSVVCNALPENSFKKYCKLFCGLVLVVLVLTPINEFLNFDGDIEDIFSAGNYDAELRALENQLRLQEQLEMDNAQQQFEVGIMDIMSGVAAEQGLYILDVEVDYSYIDEEEIVLDRVIFQVTDNVRVEGGENIGEEDEIKIGKIDEIKIDKIVQKHNVTDIDELSHEDRPKVIRFVEEVSTRLGIDSTLVSIEWKE